MQRTVCTSLIIALALMAAPALAQQQEHEQHHPAGTPAAETTPSPEMPRAMGGAGSMPMMDMMRTMTGQVRVIRMLMMAAPLARRLAFLKTELKITDAQLALWNAVADTMRVSVKNMGGMPGAMMGSARTGTLPEKLALREKMMTAHLESLRKFKMAVDPLYAAFSDEQKKTADELLIGPMGMM